MLVRLENAYTKLVDATEEEIAWVKAYLTFEDKTAFFAARARLGAAVHYADIDTEKCLYRRTSRTFPSGFLGRLRAAMRADGFEVKIEDVRNRPCDFDPDVDLDWLYDHQYGAVRAGYRRSRGIIRVPTGGGKTEIIVAFVRSLPCQWVVLVHRKGLMHDIAARWELRGGHAPGKVGDGEWRPDPDGVLTVATFQTVSRALVSKDPEKVRKAKRLLGSAEGLIVDEAHTLPAKSFWRVVMGMRRAYYRFGVSGTPLARDDQRSHFAVGALGNEVYSIEAQELIELGILAVPKINAVRIAQDTVAEKWQTAYRKLVEESRIRNAAVVEMTMIASKPAMVFVKNIGHGKELRDRLAEAGLSVEFVWGKKNSDARKAAQERLRTGRLDVIVCSVVFQEGVDIPSLRAVVNAAGMKSSIAALQRIGRGMRSDQGRKSAFEVWEVWDVGNNFLENHRRARFNAYRSAGYEVGEITMADLSAMPQLR